MMANNQNPDSEKQANILETLLALATEHLVCIWSTVDPTVKDCHKLMSSTDTEKPGASVIYKMVLSSDSVGLGSKNDASSRQR